MRKYLALVSAIALPLVAGCAVHQDTQPTATGPAVSALSITLTATPDVLPQNGFSQSNVVVKAFNAGGQPYANLTVRLDMQVNNVVKDFGTLFPRTVVTGADGTAKATYIAPPGPGASGTGNEVTLVATPIASDATTGLENFGLFQTVIRLTAGDFVPPPTETPTAVITSITPNPPTAGATILFNGTGSCPSSVSAGACATANSTLINWEWDFGDGTAHGNGSIVTHVYQIARPYAVTLTVTNSQGRSTSIVQVVTVGAGTGPTALFTALPNPASVNTEVTLDGTPSTGQIVNYKWTINSPAPVVTTFQAGQTTTFTPNAVGAWTITLTVTDTNGRSATSGVTTVNVQ